MHRARSSVVVVWRTAALALAFVAACGPSATRDFTVISTSPGGADGARLDARDARTDVPSAGEDAMGVGSVPTEVPPGSPGSPDPAPDADPGPPASPAPDAGAELRESGAPCATAGDCRSNFCVDAVCCDGACTGTCQSCNQPTARGQCTPVPAGEDPRNVCPSDPPASCGREGSCDGAGACRLYPATAECQPGGCESPTVERAAGLCDGKGACRPPTTRPCAGSTCQMGSCSTACTASADCQAGFFCDKGACRLKRGNGTACAAAGECTSGVCAAGICCNVDCSRPCVSCALAGKVGTCFPVAPGDDPGERCAAQAASTCGRDGACDGTGQCRLHAEGTECAAGQCETGAALAARRCDGKGTCQTATRASCGAFTCSAGKCATTCSGTTGCLPGYSCRAGSCLDEGLQLHWRFDEPEGIVAGDTSGNGRDGAFVTGNPGTPAGGPTATTGAPQPKFPNPHARAFDASKRHAAIIASLPQGLRPTAALTISAFYRSSGIESGGEGAELVSLGNNQLLRVLPGGFEVSKRVTRANGDNRYDKCLSAPARTDHLDGGWHHLATVVDASNIRIFFDGQLVCTQASTAPMVYDIAGRFTVGRHGGPTTEDQVYDMNGNIDDVRVYSRALGTAEISALAMGTL